MKLSGLKKGEGSLDEILPLPPHLLEEEGASLLKTSLKDKSLSLKITHQPLFLDRENFEAHLFLIKDLSEEMEMEKRLFSLAQEKELGFIKASVAHEINNPIAGMKLILSLLEKEVLEPDLKESVKDMRHAIRRCETQVKSLLQASKSKN